MVDVKAAVVPAVGADFEIRTVTLDVPGPGEVAIDVAAVGICHTDLAIRDGHLPFPLPGVLGHEGSGTVTAVGEGVTSVQVGDRVAVSFNSCGRCKHCSRNEPAYCDNFMGLNLGGVRPDGTPPLHDGDEALGSNFFGQSTFATAALANERNVVRLPDDAPLELVGPLGCGIQTGAGAILNSLDVEAGSSVAIAGAGSVGLSAVLAAVGRGARPIFVIQPNEGPRQLALDLGATDAIDPAAGVVSEQIRALVPEGVDYALDTTAITPVVADLTAALAIRGTIGLLGVPADPTAVLPVPLMLAAAIGISVRGIVEGDADPQTFIPELLDLHRQGRFPFDKLITTMPFDRINEAVAAQLSGEAIKVVLVNS